MPTSLDHFDLVVGDLERSLRFYRGLLEPLDWAHERSIVGERGESVVYLGAAPPERRTVVSLREARSPSTEPYDRYGVGLHHLAWRVESREVVEERHRWLVGIGAEIESPPREYDYAPGYYAVFFFDPDGLKLELLHRP
jgi:glyoxylase I family protein